MQSLLRFDLFKFWNKQGRFVSLRYLKICPDRFFVSLRFDIVDIATLYTGLHLAGMLAGASFSQNIVEPKTERSNCLYFCGSADTIM